MTKIQKVRKAIPFEFILEELSALAPVTKPMFGCTSVYVDEKIVFILRLKGDPAPDDGVWLATTAEHHEALRADFPSMRSLELFGPGPTGWQVLPADAEDFEESVLRACELVHMADPRIGKVPKKRLSRKKKTPLKKTTKRRSPARRSGR